MPSGPRPPIPPGVARVAISGHVLGHKWVQVFYLQLTHGVVTVNDCKSIADEIDALWNTNLVSTVPSQVTMEAVSVVFIDAVGSEVRYDGSYSRTGTNAGVIVSDASAAYVIKWAISAYYRGGHPRSYMPGVINSAVSNGSTISSGVASSFASAWNTFRNALNAFTTTNVTAIVMGTLSFQSNKVWRTTPVFRPFTSVSVSTTLGSQRRRIHS